MQEKKSLLEKENNNNLLLDKDRESNLLKRECG